MQIRKNVSLKPYNTFGIDLPAAEFLEIDSVEALQKALGLQGHPDFFVLSGGSNLLLTAPLEALVLYINIRGREILSEDGPFTIIRAMAGENWHQLVLWSLDEGLGGLENLALIPGKCGTAPIQNIGAYGVELKDVFHACEAIEVATGRPRRFTADDCRFGYRDSFFKQEGKGRYIITAVELKLSRTAHKLATSYGAIQDELDRRGIPEPTPADVAQAVIAIRQSKLPDPGVLGNSGSFFKNPVISSESYQSLKERFPDLPGYAQEGGRMKVPAGWLIEKSGFKGYRKGDAGVHQKQALVLVNYGKASGRELLDLSRRIQEEIENTFGIALTPEVNII
jgi:UDP-N-acetylmuramate dehydrogenase